jgi:hypothetical protein
LNIEKYVVEYEDTSSIFEETFTDYNEAERFYEKRKDVYFNVRLLKVIKE